MNDIELEQKIRESMKTYDEEEKLTLRRIALNSYSRDFQSGWEEKYGEVIGTVYKNDGTILKSETFSNESEARQWAKETTIELFDQNKQEEYSVSIMWTSTTKMNFYDCEKMKKIRDERRRKHEILIKDNLIAEERFNRRASRWEEACKWASENGISVRMEKDGSIGHNRRETIVKKVIEKKKMTEWNELFPEFTITQEFINRYAGVI